MQRPLGRHVGSSRRGFLGLEAPEVDTGRNVISRRHHPRKRMTQYSEVCRFITEVGAYWIPAFAGHDSGSGACFPPVLAPNKGREIGGGRATRQPGQVRKEAALTRSGSGRSSVSYLFFERIARGGGDVRALRPVSFLSASRPRGTINCGSTDE